MKPLLLSLAVLAFAGCEVNLNSEGVVSSETKRFAVSGVPELQLETFDGAIEVHSWDRDEVEVEVEKRAMEQRLVDAIKIDAQQDGQRITVRVTGPDESGERRGIQVGVSFSPSARLRVALPRNTQLTALTHDGSITIEDVEGKISLTTHDGSVRASRLAGDVTIRSGDGSIRVDRAEGTLDLETEDGSMTLRARPSVLRARTGDGSIRLELDPDTAMTGDWNLETGDGSVTLTLPSSFNATLDAETRDGVVRAREGLGIDTASREDDDRDRERRRSLRAALGTGGPTLRVRTGDGTIRIE